MGPHPTETEARDRATRVSQRWAAQQRPRSHL